MDEKVDNRWVTGRCVSDEGNPDTCYQTVAEALIWDKEEELVQLHRIWHKGGEMGWQLVKMRISGNNPQLVLTTSNKEEALQMWMDLTFGVNIF
jgi:hypothetical protein